MLDFKNLLRKEKNNKEELKSIESEIITLSETEFCTYIDSLTRNQLLLTFKYNELNDSSLKKISTSVLKELLMDLYRKQFLTVNPECQTESSVDESLYKIGDLSNYLNMLL